MSHALLKRNIATHNEAGRHVAEHGRMLTRYLFLGYWASLSLEGSVRKPNPLLERIPIAATLCTMVAGEKLTALALWHCQQKLALEIASLALRVLRVSYIGCR